MKEYHIYTGATVNYITHIRLIAIGLKKYKKPDSKYIFHIMLDDNQPLQYRMIFNGLQSEDFHVDLIGSDLINHKLSKEVLAKRMKMSYCKLFAPSLFPEADKVLWLDADLLVINEGIDQLFEQDLSNFYVAAALDIPTQFMWPHQVKNAQVNMFFNSGVMLLNTKKIREDGLDKILQHDAYQYPSQIKCINEDQAIFNYRFKQQVLWISPIFNNILYSNPLNNIKPFEHIYKQCGFDNVLDAINETVIIHWPGSAKPFKQNITFDYFQCPYWKESKEIYNKYKKLFEAEGYY